MPTLSNKIQMRQELLSYLEQLEKLDFKRTFLKEDFTLPQTQLEIIIATSITKVKIQTEELLASILDRKFFSSLSILRMVSEEVILITFILSKMKKTKSLENASHVLFKVSVGTSSYSGEKGDVPKPYNINTTLVEAENYLKSLDNGLCGIFEDSYSFISDLVHPNAPSRFHYLRNYGNKKRVISPQTTDDDVRMLLNYACMVLGLYTFSIKQLMEIDISTLPSEVD